MEDEELSQCLWGRTGAMSKIYPETQGSVLTVIIRPSCCTGLVLNPDPESDSEDSEPDGPDDPVTPSPEMDDVKGEDSSTPLADHRDNTRNVLKGAIRQNAAV